MHGVTLKNMHRVYSTENMNRLKITQTKELIKKMYLNLPKPLPSIILLGAPGIGKSETIRQVAEEIAQQLGKKFVDYDDFIADEILRDPQKYFVFVDFRLTECEPSDLLGIPSSMDSYVTFKPLKWAIVLSKTAGILFLDELTNIQRDDLKAVAYKLLLDRKVGFVKLHKDVMIIGAGNLPEHSSIANLLPAPLINRTIVLEVEPPTVEEWIEYASSTIRNPCTRIFAYLMTNKEDFIKLPEQPETLENYPTPRTWYKLTQILTSNYKKLYNREEIRNLCISLLGKEVGLKVAKFLELDVPSIQEILEKPELYRKLDLDIKAIFVCELAQWLKENEAKLFKLEKGVYKLTNENVKKLIEVIINDSEEFALLMLYSIGKVEDRVRIAMKLMQNIPMLREMLLKLKKFAEQFEEKTLVK